MPLTPVEIRHVQLRRTFLRGYRRKPVDGLLTEIADSFEEVWRERADLADQLEELETEASNTASWKPSFARRSCPPSGPLRT